MATKQGSRGDNTYNDQLCLKCCLNSVKTLKHVLVIQALDDNRVKVSSQDMIACATQAQISGVH